MIQRIAEDGESQFVWVHWSKERILAFFIDTAFSDISRHNLSHVPCC